MINNSDVERMIKENFKNMENSLNTIEEFLEDVEANASRVGFHVGKIFESYKALIELLKIDLEA